MIRLLGCRTTGLDGMPPLPAAVLLLSLPVAAAATEGVPCCGRHAVAAAEMALGSAAPLARDSGRMSWCQTSPLPWRRHTHWLLPRCTEMTASS